MERKAKETNELIDEIMVAEQKVEQMKNDAMSKVETMKLETNEKIEMMLENSYSVLRQQIKEKDEEFEKIKIKLETENRKNCTAEVNKLKKEVENKKEKLSLEIMKEVLNDVNN